MRTNHRTAPWLIAAAAALAGLAAATVLLNPPKTQAAGTAGTVVSTAKTGLGRILVNSRGHTLYLFGKDRKGKSACAGMCATLLAAPDRGRQAARGRRYPGVPARNDQARRRTSTGDLQPPSALHVRQGQAEGPDER
jgi:predicted lipoprotein with Yx(FWY)xxD motif